MRNLLGERTSRAGVVIGIGMGGFVDGIVLHQVLHWHNMGSAVLPPTTMEAMQRNMVWDGLFHAGTWLITFAGVWMLYGAAAARTLPTRRAFLGQMLMGWGLFNLVEGAIDHHLLNLHHVRDLPAHVPLYDWVFLAVAGVGFTVAGRLLSRKPRGWGV
jgi:uncharacterized membrane protein